MPKFWTSFFSGQSLLLSTTILNDISTYVQYQCGVATHGEIALKNLQDAIITTI